MKIKQKGILFAAFIMMVSTIGLSFVSTDSANALTDKEIQACADEWGGRSTDSEDSQALSDKDLKDFKASKCAKGSDPVCSLTQLPKTDWKYIQCKETGDGEDVTPSADVVASQIKKGNYKDYTNAAIEEKCREYFKGKAAKFNSCVEQAKEKRNELKAKHDEKPTEEGVDACKVKTSIIPVDCSKGGNPIWGLLLMAVNILTAGIGIVAIGGIVYASILWTTAEDKNAQIVKSKETIFNVVVGLVAFALLWAFLNFLIPGGVFSAGP